MNNKQKMTHFQDPIDKVVERCTIDIRNTPIHDRLTFQTCYGQSGFIKEYNTMMQYDTIL